MPDYVSHRLLGLCKNTMTDLFTNAGIGKTYAQPEKIVKPLQNPNIPLLDNYKLDPGDSFWDVFPKCPIPSKISCPLDLTKFTEISQSVRQKFTTAQKQNMDMVLQNLEFGADPMADPNLPGLDLPNSPSMLQQDKARYFTDILASLVKKGTIIGRVAIMFT